MNHTQRKFSSLFIPAMLLVASCSQGGGGGGTTSPPPPPPPPPPTSTGPTWTAGVYQPASQFKDRCQVVRTGVDINGDAFPDMAGSTLEENFWLRSWTNETYLWNDEVTDQNPANFSNPLSYFSVLRTTALTPSGAPKDQFHFSQPTDEFLASRNSTPEPDYGASLFAFSTTVPRDYRVRYTEPNSPASTVVAGEANLVRGTRLLEVDGIDIVNATSQANVNAINNALFPSTVGQTHTFRVQDPGGAPRNIMMSAANIASKPVNRTSIISTGTGNVGYILLNTFSPFQSEEDIVNAMNDMIAQNVTDLVVDLRYNGGGLLATASQLGYMIAGDAQTNGKTYELLRFNADAGNQDPVNGGLNEPLPFFDTGLGFTVAQGTPLGSLDLPRVYILSTGRTCSASESLINALRGVDVEVVLIGGTTCGKPFGFYPQDNCGETYFTIQFQGVNDKGFGDYADGFIPNDSSAAFGVRIPGCQVNDDIDSELGDATEALLATALFYRDNGTCPSPAFTKPSAGVAASTVQKPSGEPVLLTRKIRVMDENRDMTMPN